VRPKTMTTRRQLPLVHRVEGPDTVLVGPSKMTTRKPLRPHRLAPPLQPGHLRSEKLTSIVSAAAETEDTEPDRPELHRDGCSEVEPSLRTPSPPDDDGDSAALYRTISRTGGSTGISASITSGGAADVGEKAGDVGEHARDVGEHNSDLGEEGGAVGEHSAGGDEGEKE
jgi:hypothetical protein